MHLEVDALDDVDRAIALVNAAQAESAHLSRR